MGYDIKLTEKAKDFIAERGYDEKFGARPLKRAIQKYLEDPLAEEIIDAHLNPGDLIKVDFDKKSDSIVMKIEKGKATPKSIKPKGDDTPTKEN